MKFDKIASIRDRLLSPKQLIRNQLVFRVDKINFT